MCSFNRARGNGWRRRLAATEPEMSCSFQTSTSDKHEFWLKCYANVNFKEKAGGFNCRNTTLRNDVFRSKSGFEIAVVAFLRESI